MLHNLSIKQYTLNFLLLDFHVQKVIQQLHLPQHKEPSTHFVKEQHNSSYTSIVFLIFMIILQDLIGVF